MKTLTMRRFNHHPLFYCHGSFFSYILLAHSHSHIAHALAQKIINMSFSDIALDSTDITLG